MKAGKMKLTKDCISFNKKKKSNSQIMRTGATQFEFDPLPKRKCVSNSLN
jgi:hypothetical protein